MAKRKKSSKSKKSKSKSSFWILFLIGAVVTCLYFFNSPTDDIAVKNKLFASMPEGFPTFGIDVSHHQGEIDWEKLFVEQHYDTIIGFVYCKATEGTDHLDTRWKTNREALERLKIPNGAYHFFNPSTDPDKQADHFLKNWSNSDYDLPPVLDVETEGSGDKQLIKKMLVWLEKVEKKTGMRPVIYTSLNFFETKFQDKFKDYKFWIAAYSRRPSVLEDSRIIHWQYSESGELPEITENVDFNVSKIVYE